MTTGPDPEVPAEAVAAATLILFRDAPGGPEHLFVERAAGMAFAGGAVVFPGGRVDPSDTPTGAADREDAAARAAAVRETHEEAGVAVAIDTLVYFARWCPPPVHNRTFDTRFFIAPVAADTAGVVDGTEHTRLFWARAADVLAMADRGEVRMIFPTRRNLERLAQFASFADAVADVARHPVRLIMPVVDGDVVRIPGDCGYPVCTEPVASAMRG